MLFLDADRIFSVMSPADAVNALSSALVAGFDPADDLSRVVNPIDKGSCSSCRRRWAPASASR
ncbi:hypothetical protein [Dermacoccus sp. 147Ba]|uniref:hypothetical protein n=1 Tax=Dermacoccus sp. 147Ba TaxID=2510111 RepID=UPI001F0ECA4C|nr:hypothetical protein [Dermacoccus sp. 147Ba]